MSTIIPANGRATYIISAERECFTHGQNAEAMQHLATLVSGCLARGEVYTVAHCEGAYKGSPERSLAIVAPAGWIGAAARLGHMFEQESILRISPAGDGVLHFMADTDALPIGLYTPCDADTVDAWTRVLATGETFTFR